MILTEAEIKALTRKVRRSAQRRALRLMGIPFTVRSDGSPVVSRQAAEAALGAIHNPAREPQLRL